MKAQTVILFLLLIFLASAVEYIGEDDVEDYFNDNDVDAQFFSESNVESIDDSENDFSDFNDVDATTDNTEAQSTEAEDVSDSLESTIAQNFNGEVHTLRRSGGGFRSGGGSRSSGGFRSSSSRSSGGFRSSSSSRSSGGFRSSSSRSSGGFRSGSRSTRSRSRSSFYSSSRRRRTTYVKVRVPYTSFRTRYQTTIFRTPRPFVVNYGGHTFNTFNTYTYNGTFTEPVILIRVGNNIYRKTTMRIRYRVNGVFATYWRNVIIDLVTGAYYIIDPTTPAGNTPLASPQTFVNGVPVQPPAGASTLSTDSTVVITQAPGGSEPSTNDEESQNVFRMQDAASQDTLAVEYQSSGSAGPFVVSLISIAIALLAILF